MNVAPPQKETEEQEKEQPAASQQRAQTKEPQQSKEPVQSDQPTQSKQPTLDQQPPSPNGAGGLSNDNYYTNTKGNDVHSPANCTDGSVPPGATALCADGTYSSSEDRRGTCSHQGGVSRWLR